MKDVYPYVVFDEEVFKLNGKPVVDVVKITLPQWLELLNNKKVYVPNYQFPTDEHKEEYISRIHEYSEADFRDLIRHFLMENGCLSGDLRGVTYRLEHHPDLKLEFDRRLLNCGQPWEGITWVLDLLSSRPTEALEVLRSYFYVHCQLLPDGRLMGLSDAMSLVRARYLSTPQTSDEIYEMLLNLNPRDFEALVAKLYMEMGYSVQLTPYSKDDGADIICNRDDPGRRELIIIQCKRYRDNVGLKHLKELLGTVTDRKATKGVLVTPGNFTRDAIKKANLNPQIELLGGLALQNLLAQHLGARWVVNLDRLIMEGTRG
jgi:restriction system protein